MKHTIAVIVENKSGVLTRIAGLFSAGLSTSTASPWELRIIPTTLA